MKQTRFEITLDGPLDADESAVLCDYQSGYTGPRFERQPMFWDIETEPLTIEELVRICPEFESKLKKPGEFNPDDVKLGNMKDEAKIKEKIDRERAKHEKAIRDFDKTVKQAETEYWEKVAEDATLKATRSRVCTIQIGTKRRSDPIYFLHGDDERWIIETFWDLLTECMKQGQLSIGFNIFGFDIPYLIRRSWILGIKIPDQLLGRGGRGVPGITDLHEGWRLGQYGEFVSLAEVGAAMGVGTKRDIELRGGDFHLYWNRVDLRPVAIEYGCADIRDLREIAAFISTSLVLED